jgi:hypothetical protein
VINFGQERSTDRPCHEFTYPFFHPAHLLHALAVRQSVIQSKRVAKLGSSLIALD